MQNRAIRNDIWLSANVFEKYECLSGGLGFLYSRWIPSGLCLDKTTLARRYQLLVSEYEILPDDIVSVWIEKCTRQRHLLLALTK